MMRKKTAKLVSTLAAQHPKRTLLALWSDLRTMDRAEFEGLLAAGAKNRPSAKRAARKPEDLPLDDTPSARIEYLLLKQAAMDEPRAADQLKAQLVHQGIEASRIPSARGRQFANWLSMLFRSVPASQVLHAALQISRKPSR